MNNFKGVIRQSLHEYLDEIFGYFRDPDNIVFKEQGKRKEDNSILSDVDRVRSSDYQQPVNMRTETSMGRLNSEEPANRCRFSNIS